MIIGRLATSLGLRDENANIELAKSIAASMDQEAVSILVEHLKGKNSAIQSDCIKALYETGYIQPALLAPHLSTFAGLLNHKNNRLQWGAMTALDAIASVDPDGVFDHLPAIMDAADHGSVITRDHAVGILAQLLRHQKHHAVAFPLLIEQLLKCPVNQFPSYVEKAAPGVSAAQKEEFVRTLRSRMIDLEKDSQKKRVEKVLKKLK